VQNVVFPCGLTIKKQEIYMYYGAADYVIGVARMKLASILKMLEV
jgi:predicted GH43/DUF377 family glycosyl hydrolase